jgi:limonene-1,2-epoxide hydrolase
MAGMTPGETVSSFIHDVEAKRLDEALELVSPDVEYDNVPVGKVHGPDGIRGVLEPFLRRCTTLEWVVHHQVEQPDAAGDGPEDGTVMNERTDRFEMGGRWVEVAVAGLFTVQGGRITLWRDYFDDASFRAQLEG